MAAALARVLQEQGLETLIICPKNLVQMWKDYVYDYQLNAKVMSLSTVIGELPEKTRRYRVIILDESHNLRNREGKRYKAIQQFVEKNGSKCILLSATPYNKSYLDLSAQLRLFVPADLDLGVRPEHCLRDVGETEFIRRHQCSLRSLAAFEHSEHPDDWRELMRLYLIRRTRSFIKDNYAKADEYGRKYLTFENGDRFYFPDRVPKTATFQFNEKDPNDPYARLYSDEIVNAINGLMLPRYGLGNYIPATPSQPPTPDEAREIAKLSRAGQRLMGFCRTNLFKRLESGGPAFLQSIERHVLRNFIFLHAIDNDLPLPVGTQAAEMLDGKAGDQDFDDVWLEDEEENGNGNGDPSEERAAFLRDEKDYRKAAGELYNRYWNQYHRRFKWLKPSLFVPSLKKHLAGDAHALIRILHTCGTWDPAKDAKLDALHKLLVRTYPDTKVLVFTQFADTLLYLTRELKGRGVQKLEGVSGGTENPTAFAYRFSPQSNKAHHQVKPGEELRVLLATDVLSEGQNLQDCFVIVNYDLPWAIIRLIQRAGRVDRIGQKSDKIFCHSFIPADGIERIINLRRRVRQRLHENAEVIGADEHFFEDDLDERPLLDLYNERSGILEDMDTEVDLASYAYQIWKNATDADPKLQKIISDLSNVVYSTKPHVAKPEQPDGVLVYMRTAEGNDSLAWVDEEGKAITESQLAILKAAECMPNTPALPRLEKHHELVTAGVRHMVQEEKSIGGGLGRPSGARFRTYERLIAYQQEVKGTLFDTQDLAKAIDDIYRYPLQQYAADALNAQLRLGINTHSLADLVITLRGQDRLSLIQEETETQEPQIICSLALSEQRS
jgi:superfamily II DNA or RNA helicase